MENEYQIEGKNAILQAFAAGRVVDKLFVAQGARDLGEIVHLARENGAAVNFVPPQRIFQMAFTPKPQGVIAMCAPVAYSTIEQILQKAKTANEEPFIIALDSIMDPHNLGAIIRSANAAGAHGVIITKYRSCGLNATVAKTSAGAVEWTPVAKVVNLVQTLEILKKKGLWIYGAAGKVANSYTNTEMSGALCIVIGNEGAGLSRNVVNCCDFLVSIPMHGKIESLNASVAGALIMYEVRRQRASANG